MTDGPHSGKEPGPEVSADVSARRPSSDAGESSGFGEAPTSAGAGVQGEEAQPTEAREPARKKKKKKKKKTGLGSSRGVETMFRTTYRTHINLSSIADNKANIMLSINGIIISVIIASVSPKIDANPWLLIPTSSLLLGCVISMVYAVLAARPRIVSTLQTLEDFRRDKPNILFFGNFVNLSEDDYLEGMTELLTNTDDLYQNMMKDLYGLGKVLARKYELLRSSYNVFMYGITISVALFVLVFILVVLLVPDATPGL
jgi:hypothetical protein